jgi:hypothetical protein
VWSDELDGTEEEKEENEDEEEDVEDEEDDENGEEGRKKRGSSKFGRKEEVEAEGGGEYEKKAEPV